MGEPDWIVKLRTRQEASDPETANDGIVRRPNQAKFYYENEEEKRGRRPDEARLFITRWLKDGDVGCWLRTRFSDNHPHDSKYRLLRDIVWSVETGRFQSAKTNLTALLAKLFQMERSKYCSLACTVASALSNHAENVTFECGVGGFVTSMRKHDLVRKRFALLMGIVFKKVKERRLLVDKDGSNVYRLVYCQSYLNGDESWLSNFMASYWILVFTFSLQLTLLVYVILEISFTIRDEGFIFEWRLAFLGILSSAFSLIQVVSFLRKDKDLFFEATYSGWIKWLDGTVNILLPLLTIPVGFLIIVLQDEFIEAVLNTAALIFIPTIDDEIPGYLDMDGEDIVDNFMIKTAMEALERVLIARDDSGLITKFAEGGQHELIDVFVTNHKEEGGEPENDLFAPYNIIEATVLAEKANVVNGEANAFDGVATSNKADGTAEEEDEYVSEGEENDVNVSVSSCISRNSLIREVKWRYSRKKSSQFKGFLTHLHIQKMDGTTVSLTYGEEEPSGWDGKLSGVFVITRFRRINNITRLRLCGTPDDDCNCGNAKFRLKFHEAKRKFKEAMEFYSLWDLDKSAEKLLDSAR